MSYDLYFWRYADETTRRALDDHIATCHALAAGMSVAGLVDLDGRAIREGLARIRPEGWAQDGDGWVKPKPGDPGGFGAVAEVVVGERHVSVTLRGRWRGDDVNPVIDLMRAHGCPLFDPQVRPRGERFPAP